MVSYLKPLSLEVACPTTAGAAINVSSAHDVRIVNSGGTARLVTISSSANSGDSASMTIAPNDTVIVPKASTDIMFGAHADLKLTSVQKPRG